MSLPATHLSAPSPSTSTRSGSLLSAPDFLHAITELTSGSALDAPELVQIIATARADGELRETLCQMASDLRDRIYGRRVFFRGLIEFSNYCANDCFYCGIRAGNNTVNRYRLSLEDILSSCQAGYELGYRTFVLQSGEDPYFTDDRMVAIIQEIHHRYPDCAITLSIGEKDRASYQRFFDAGANRYLLRHESATPEHYAMLHPSELDLLNRKRCLYDLMDIGYQTGAGFMVGPPGQTAEHLANDLIFLRELQPHMVGIGPFLPASNTPFATEPAGSVEDTLIMVALTRLTLPAALIPATTALGSLDHKGREKGLKAGANVVMPNLTPTINRKDYSLYDGKICTGDEAAECRVCIEGRIRSVGFDIDLSRGDHLTYNP
jgi:biotin synthase